MYYELCHSIWTYGIIAWGGAYNKEINSLKNLLNRIDSKIPELKSENLDAKTMYTYYLHALLLHYDKLSQDYTASTSRTRNKSLRIPEIKKELYKKSCFYTALTQFNKLPTELKTINNTASTKVNVNKLRKSKLKKFYLLSVK